MIFSRALLLILVSFTFWNTNAQVSLRYDLKKNDSFAVKHQAIQVISQDIIDNEQVITNTINGIILFTVKDIKPNRYVIEMKFTDLKLMVNSNVVGELINIDAKKIDEENPQSKIFNGILDFPIIFNMEKNGDIISVDGGDELIENMLASASIDDAFMMELMKTSLQKDYSSKALADSYKQMTYFYPKKEVAVNDTWENHYSGELSAKNTWKLNAISNGEASITANGSINMNLEDSGAIISLSGTQKIQLVTNISNGFLKEMIIESSAKGNSIIAQLEDTDIPTMITSKITYNLIK